MLDEICGCPVYLKAECLQRTGSFKFRGAYNRLAAMSADERGRGIVAWSSGNHAQGVAAAARLLHVDASIVMPADAPRAKIDGTRRYGATIVFYDRETENREEIAYGLARERDAIVVPSFDDPYIIAGQGTLAAEVIEDLTGEANIPDCFLAPCGGGGLIAGCATIVSSKWKKTRIYSVEPEAFADTARSLAAGERLRNRKGITSVCDALLADEPGRLTFEVNRRLLAGGLAVSDQAAIAAVQFAFRHLKLVVEPSGAVALAAALQGLVPGKPRGIVIVLSGGNIDPVPYSKMVANA
jgi:threonine dehydratase